MEASVRVFVGEQDALAEQLFFEVGSGLGLGAARRAAARRGRSPCKGGGDDPGEPAGLEDRGDLGLDLVLGFAGLAPAQAGGQLGELAAGLGQGLVEAPGLLVVQVLGVGDHDAPLGAEDHLAGLKGAQARKAPVVDGPVAALGHGQQVGMVRGRQRADEVQRRVPRTARSCQRSSGRRQDQGELGAASPARASKRATSSSTSSGNWVTSGWSPG